MSLHRFVSRALPLHISWYLVAERVGLRGTKVVAVTETALGHMVDLSIRPPTTVVTVGLASHEIAVAFGLARVRVLESPSRADRLTVWLDARLSVGAIDYAPEDNPVGMPLDPMRELPIGLDDNGDKVAFSPYGQHILIGGNPGSGKSVAMRVLLAGLAASRNVCLMGIDPKHAELSMWSPRFDRLVLGNEVGPTVELLLELLTEVQRRAIHLAALQTATLRPSPEFPWIILVVDEWAEIGAVGDNKERTQINTLLRRFLSLGRAVGCTAILCTQRPTSDAIDVGTRALTTHRFALKCGDRHQAEAILGVGAFVPDQLRSAAPGRALWTDGGPATAVQFYNLTDEQVPLAVKAPFRGLGRM